MARVFITGATGFLGLNLMECLAEKDWDVTALYRPGADLTRLNKFPVTLVEGDITDPASLSRAMPKDIDYVFHVAADTSVVRKYRARQKTVNVDGARNVITAALNAGARRLIHTSSASTYGGHKDMIDETAPQTGRWSPIHYTRTKSEAEKAVRTAAECGLDAVICNPGHILGRYDLTGWAQIFMHVKNGTLPGIPPGSGSFAHAKEVAKAHIAAAESGKSGENYFLGGPHMSFAALAREISRLLKIDMPVTTTPGFLIRLGAWLGESRALLTGKEPSLSLDAARFVCQHHVICSKKAERVLGYQPPPIKTALIDCYRWLAERGLI